MKTYLFIISLALSGCGGGGSSGGGGKATADPVAVPVIPDDVTCLVNNRNCSDADVDLDAPVIWAADNGIKIVHIRWAKCVSESAAKYAYEHGVTIICLAGDDKKEIVENSAYTITVGSKHKNSNYGAGIDFALLTKGTIHSGIYATALAATDRQFENWGNRPYPDPIWSSNKTILIVDNGFDSVRPLYVLYKNTALAGEITGDYGIKALNELSRWVDVDVIGYVPFNTVPDEPRIDNWAIN